MDKIQLVVTKLCERMGNKPEDFYHTKVSRPSVGYAETLTFKDCSITKFNDELSLDYRGRTLTTTHPQKRQLEIAFTKWSTYQADAIEDLDLMLEELDRLIDDNYK